MSEVKNEQYFMEHQDEFEALTEGQRNDLLLNGEVSSEGETAVVPAADAGDTNTNDNDGAPAVETPAVPEPVVLAKDGKHTIPFAELEETRERARYWEAKALEMAAAQPAAKTEDTAQTEPTAVGYKTLRDQAQAALLEGDTELAAELNAKADEALLLLANENALKLIEPYQKREQESAVTRHFESIRAAHSDFDSIIESGAIAEWVEKQPSIVKEAYQSVLKQGNSQQVIELFDIYKGQTEKPSPAEAPNEKEAVARKAGEAIANAKSDVPNSLTDLPSGSRTANDEAEAIRNMDGMNLIDKFAGKTPDQIMELVSRVI